MFALYATVYFAQCEFYLQNFQYPILFLGYTC